MQSLDDIKNLEQKFIDIFKSKDNEYIMNIFHKQLQELNSLCVQLQSDMNSHLNEEEEIVPKLFKEYKVTEKEELETCIKISKDLGMKYQIYNPI